MKPRILLTTLFRVVPQLALALGLGLVGDHSLAASFIMPDEADAGTEAGFCATGDCRTKQLIRVSPHRRLARASRKSSRPRPTAPVTETKARPATTAATSFDEKMGLLAYGEAVRGRRMADFRGGGWRSGNTSKSMCASVVKDVLKQMNVCRSRPGGHAIDLHTSGSLRQNCGVQKSSTKNPSQAPKNSVIVYSGYAGNRPHEYGHVELKLVVTPALKRRMAGDGQVNRVPVGGYIYCSDYCRSVPTQSRRGTNPVAAIYEMK